MSCSPHSALCSHQRDKACDHLMTSRGLSSIASRESDPGESGVDIILAYAVSLHQVIYGTPGHSAAGQKALEQDERTQSSVAFWRARGNGNNGNTASS